MNGFIIIGHNYYMYFNSRDYMDNIRRLMNRVDDIRDL